MYYFLVWLNSKFYARRGLFLNIWVEEGMNSNMRMLIFWWKSIETNLGMSVLVMVLVGYKSDDNGLRVWEKLDGLPFQLQISSSETTTCNTPFFGVWVIRNQWLWALLSMFILWRKREWLKLSFLTRLHSSLVPWRSLNRLNDWGTKNIFGVDCWDSCTQK